MKEIIRTKKNGKCLSKNQIEYWVNGVTDGSVPDYQSSALLMAICFQGMNIEERSNLTLAMANSGHKLSLGEGDFIVDKHSSGGVGDKTSLILAPLLATLGFRVPMISGRGLGFTGGTLDKLEAIDGYNINISDEAMVNQVNQLGCFIAGQTLSLAPADKKLYSLRDVTQTVDEISLITSSILSKKFCEDLGGLVLDIKCGSGAFMKNLDSAKELAKSLTATVHKAGLKCSTYITAMNFPTGEYVGNIMETYECFRAMHPSSSFIDRIIKQSSIDKKHIFHLNSIDSVQDILIEITINLALGLMTMQKTSHSEALTRIIEVWQSGDLLKKFIQLVTTQGGDVKSFERKSAKILACFESQKDIITYVAPESGYISHVDAAGLGNLMIDLGAGRKVATETIDHSVTLKSHLVPKRYYHKGDTLVEIYTSAKIDAMETKNTIAQCLKLSKEYNADNENLILDKL